jgi:nucleoside-diphosphate-sugar epimerase
MKYPKNKILLFIVWSLWTKQSCYGFGNFQFPQMPWDGRKTTSPSTSSSKESSSILQPGDTIAVMGASGNVGKLVALRLSDTYRVHAVTRDVTSVQEFFEGRESSSSIRLFEVDLLQAMKNSHESDNKFEENISSSDSNEKSIVNLRTALEGAHAIVICTGTTAFPTKAWSPRTGDDSTNDNIAVKVVSALIEGKFSVPDAIRRLDEQGYNTPRNVDALSNEFILQTWQQCSKVRKKRAILLSSIGVKRRDTMPFPILNACGVLDAKAAGEDALQRYANDLGFSFTIIRPGQLFGGPYDNNYYLGTLFQLDKDAETQDVQLGLGDELLGDTLRSTLAEITAQVCETNTALDVDFACINVKGPSPSVEAIRSRLTALKPQESLDV